MLHTLTAVALLAGVLAQDAPPPGARPVLDMALVTAPGQEGHCLDLPAGEMYVRLQVRDSGAPIHYLFYGYRGLDRDSTIEFTTFSGSTTTRATLTGGTYCYYVENQLRPPPDISMAELTGYYRRVDLQMMFVPASGGR